MQSKWIELKEEAIQLRKKGTSIKTIETRLGIARSTLSGWLRGIELTEEQKIDLKRNWEQALVNARKKAVVWHNQQKIERLRIAEEQALRTLSDVNINNKSVLDIALAFLYLGEGSKKDSAGTSIANSNPLILKFIIAAFEKNYDFSRKKIKCELHLRADQDPLEMRSYWSIQLGIPIKNFFSPSVDKRTVGRETYSGYKGVCVLRFGSVAIQRKLMYLCNAFAEKIINERAVSSVGRAFD